MLLGFEALALATRTALPAGGLLVVISTLPASSPRSPWLGLT
jgi:hypothetical protein